MPDILSGPDGTAATHSPRTTTHRPPNHRRITPISSHMGARTVAELGSHVPKEDDGRHLGHNTGAATGCLL